MDNDSPWDDDTSAVRDAEWSKLSTDFQNVGYREGITAGKESALQAGFDEGFAMTGAPLGREIGILQGTASAVLSLLTSSLELPALDHREISTTEARDIVAQLSEIRFSDIAPPDLEAKRHALEHLESKDSDDQDMDLDLGEEFNNKRDMENLEDMMSHLGASKSSSAKNGRPTPEDVKKLSDRLRVLCQQLHLNPRPFRD